MRAWFDRWFFLAAFLLGAALAVLGVVSRVPGPLVPAVEGLGFMLLLLGVYRRYEARRTDSPAYQQHVSNIRDYARAVRTSALFISDNTGNLFQATNPIDTSLPRARDFLAHYPKLGPVIDEWNGMARGYRELLGRFSGFSHKTSEAITGAANSSLARLLVKYGSREVDLDAVIWRVENGRLDASWERDVDDEPAFSYIMAGGATDEVAEQVKAKVAAFPAHPLALEMRRQREINDRLRPVLISAFDEAEQAVELEGRCPHCPK